jgi:hypothetical protein
MEEYLKNVNNINEVFYASTNENFKNCKTQFFNDDVTYVETKQLNYNRKPFMEKDNELFQNFTIELNPNQLAKNIKVNDMSNIEYIKLTAGGQYIDKINADIFNVLFKLYDMKKNVLPFYLNKSGLPYLKSHKYDIIIKKKNNSDIFLTYDIYSHNMDIYDDKLECYCHNNNSLVLQVNNQISSLIDINNEKFSRLHQEYINPMYFIIINKNFTNPVLNIGHNHKLKLLKINEVDDYNIYTLTKNLEEINKYGINFSCIQHGLLIEFEENINSLNRMEIYTINSDIFRISSGMGGLAFWR